MVHLEGFELTPSREEFLRILSEHEGAAGDRRLSHVQLCDRWRRLASLICEVVVLDYDGTLVSAHTRSELPRSSITGEILRLAEADVEICIASGRGTAVSRYGDSLVKLGVKRITLVRWNGFEAVELPSKTVLWRGSSFDTSTLDEVQASFKKLRQSMEIVSVRPQMVRIAPKETSNALEQIGAVQGLKEIAAIQAVVTASGHHIEICPSGTSKGNTVSRVFSIHPDRILVIADSCYAYGNDNSLATRFPALCVEDNPVDYIEWAMPVINSSGQHMTGTLATNRVLSSLVP